MGCRCNEDQPGTNCQCSEPIVLSQQGLKGDTGATGAAGTSGVVVLHNDLTVASQTGIYNGTLDTYPLDTDVYMGANGDKVKVIIVFEVTANASGFVGIFFDGNGCGSLYTFAPGPAKIMKMEVIINRKGGGDMIFDQMWDNVPSTSGAIVSRYARPYEAQAIVMGGDLDITINASQIIAGESIYLRQFSVESYLIVT